MDVAPVLSGCCICFTLMLHVFCPDVAYAFTYMLQVFYLDVAYVFQWLHICFPRVTDVCCKCFNSFRRLLQMLSLDVTKVDLVLYMLQWTPYATAACCSCWAFLHAHGCGGGVRGKREKPHGHKFRRSERRTRSNEGHGAGTRHEAALGPHVKQACGAGVRTLAFPLN
jgi:hypothetical protein